ncbi:endogenous retrovirus group S71 member 1 Env polyprotein-like [Panthera uncia]|uniref:endogenous retrovirus group S71 member 1 Env polyprotein-like n=1 Tax=Panthera uncia TaxID=29064 RepID=UPI0020FFC819|nr:endogenous retrovirus group S71 member 1 Env polyprotein-like [Panthera uncia]
MGKVIASNTSSTVPCFLFDLCDLVGDLWRTLVTNYKQPKGFAPPVPENPYMVTYGCGHRDQEQKLANIRGLYSCPANGKVGCEGEGQYHCAKWGCETLAPWLAGQGHDPLITLLRTPDPKCKTQGKCNVTKICLKKVSSSSIFSSSWDTGHTLGLRMYAPGVDKGIFLTIQRVKRKTPPNLVGPNKDMILHPPLFPTVPSQPTLRSGAPTKSELPTTGHIQYPFSPETHWLDVVDSMYAWLNSSHTEIVQDCWLCLNPKPPYYVGVATNAGIGQDIEKHVVKLLNPSMTLCPWGSRPILTLRDLQGQRWCIVSQEYNWQNPPYKNSCAEVYIPSSSDTDSTQNIAYRALTGAWFVCSSGITPCTTAAYFGVGTQEICILVHILPQIYLYSGEAGREHLRLFEGHSRVKRAAPVLIPLLVGLGIVGSTAIGTAGLIVGDQNFKTVSKQVDQDLGYLETSISQLEHQVDSLAEVVLQNRRGLDLLFMKEGGLCMALGETCCFYANNSGVIRDTLSLVRDNLRTRECAREASNNWYQSLFSWPPWLTSLLTAVAGPLLLLLLRLIIGPCIINWLVQYVKRRVSEIKIMMIMSNYVPLVPNDESRD